MADVLYLLLGGRVVGAVIAALWLRGKGVAEVAALRERAANLEKRGEELKTERDGFGGAGGSKWRRWRRPCKKNARRLQRSSRSSMTQRKNCARRSELTSRPRH